MTEFSGTDFPINEKTPVEGSKLIRGVLGVCSAVNEFIVYMFQYDGSNIQFFGNIHGMLATIEHSIMCRYILESKLKNIY